MLSYWQIIVITAASIVATLHFTRRFTRFPLPPGPRGLPVVGNLFGLPSSFEWIAYAHWGRYFNSDIICFSTLGRTIVVVNTLEATNELFENRSTNYSSRPRFVMLNELMQWNWLFTFMPYGDAWRTRRRLFHREFNPTMIDRYQPQELKCTRRMLRRLLDKPDDFAKHLRDLAGAIIMSVAYGIDVLPENDPYIAVAETAMHGMSEATIPGTFLVDFIPLLKYIPEWMPGADFKRKAKMWREFTAQVVEKPFAVVQQSLAKGEALQPSFVSYCLGSMESSVEDTHTQQRIVQETAAGLYEGGSDTTVSAMNTFILAMVCHPEVQKKAQEELDRVLPPGHLPDFGDEQALPYISAIVKEVLRWQPPVPLAVPHSATDNDVYNNYLIPAGSTVIGNAWAILHDETIYPDPNTFNPDRFMKDGKLNQEIRDPSVVFGFGRRICPARHMANSSIWIAAASILRTFTLSKAIDDNGRTIEPSQEYNSGLISHPLPFRCTIRPRSPEAVSLIHLATEL